VLRFDEWRGFSLDPCPNLLRRRFFDAYKNDEEFRRVDLFVCSHPVANCELFMPFNRSILVYATTRLEFGRNDQFVDWRKPYARERSETRALSLSFPPLSPSEPRACWAQVHHRALDAPVGGVGAQPQADRERRGERGGGEQHVRRALHQVPHRPRRGVPALVV